MLQRIDALTELGIALHKLGDMEEAERAYDKAQGLLAAMEEGKHSLRIEARLMGCVAIFNHQRGEPLEVIKADYLRAITMCERVEDVHSKAIFRLNLGDLQYESLELEEARASYREALTLLARLGERHNEARLLFSLGAMAQEEGDFEEAAAAYAKSQAILRQIDEPRSHGDALRLQGTLHHEQGELEEAIASYTCGAALLEHPGGRRLLGLCLAKLGVAQAMAGALAPAAENIERGSALLKALGDPALEPALELYDAQLRFARWQHNRSFAELDLDHLRQQITQASAAYNVEVRRAARLMRQALQRRDGAGWRVDVDGRGFEGPGQPWVDLSRRRTLRPVLKALVDAFIERPGEGLTVDELFEAGWAGQRVSQESMTNRVYVAISTLRKLGLRDILLQQDQGYQLDPDVQLTVDA